MWSERVNPDAAMHPLGTPTYPKEVSSAWAINSAQLVAIRITDISQVQRRQTAFAKAGRIFDGHSAMRNGRVVEPVHQFW